MMRTTLFKRATLSFAIVLTVGLLVLLEMMAGPRKRFHELVVSQSEWTATMAAREETTGNLIDALNFDGQILNYDSSESRWFYSLVEGSSTAYDPTVRVKSSEAVSLVVLSDELSEEMVERNETRKLMAYTNDEYRVYDLTVTTLPIMSIEYEGEISMTDEKSGMMQLFDNRKNAKQRVTNSDADFHRRGGVSLTAEKPNLKMELKVESLGGNERNNFVSLLGMRQDDDWVLYAAEDTINNVFSSNLWNETSAEVNSLGVHNGYEYKYIELISNGKYEGLYALGYRPDEKMMALISDEAGDYTEYMFRKADWGNTYYTEDKEWDEGLVTDNFSLISATKHEGEAWKILDEYFQTIIESRDITKLKTASDLNTTIDYHLFLNLIQAIDQVSGKYDKNYFLTFKKNAAGDYVALYTPWDLDVTLGREFVAGNLNPTVNVEVEISPVARLLEIGAGVDLSERYRDLRMGLWSDEEITKRFDEYEKQVFGSGAYSRNAKRWGIETTVEEQNFKRIKKYMLSRLKFLDQYYGVADTMIREE